MTEETAGRPDPGANRKAKRKQYLTFYVIAGFISCLAIAVTWLAGSDASLEDLAGKPRLTLPGEGADVAQLWRQSAEQDIKVLEESEKRLRQSLAKMEERLEEVVDDIEQARIAEQEAAFEREVLKLAAINTDPPPPVISPPALPGDHVDPPIAQAPGIVFVKVNAAASDDETAGSAPANPSPAPTPAPAAPAATPAVAGLSQADYIPSGSFMAATILGGIDAPTGAVSRDNPHPVLLRVDQEARLPNLARKDLRECLVLAAGYGDISSERALLRTERMSCRLADGTFFDAPIKGFVVGEDGRAGVRGRLVTKQGQILQRSLVAGIGSGLSEVFRTRYAERLRASAAALATEQPEGAAPPVDDGFGNYAAAGLASGTGTALGRLSDYYIALADRIHPIIEIGAGRTVDIVLQEGVSLAEPTVLDTVL